MAIPSTFNEEFLLWFRARTEAGWKKISVYSVEADPEEEWAGKWHPDWRGARWLDPLPDEEINAIEQQWEIRFPPDYRLLFKMLHATNKRFAYADCPGEYSVGLFYNWRTAPSSIQWAYEHILHGFAFDTIYNTRRFWRSEWGAVPLTEEEARERLKPIVGAAPRLIPLYLHRYLLAEPCLAGNPVFSIWQSDIIVIAPDLRTYVLREWGHPWSHSPSLLRLTHRDERKVDEEIRCLIEERKHLYKAIPFWGDYLPSCWKGAMKSFGDLLWIWKAIQH